MRERKRREGGGRHVHVSAICSGVDITGHRWIRCSAVANLRHRSHVIDGRHEVTARRAGSGRDFGGARYVAIPALVVIDARVDADAERSENRVRHRVAGVAAQGRVIASLSDGRYHVGISDLFTARGAFSSAIGVGVEVTGRRGIRSVDASIIGRSVSAGRCQDIS